MNRSRAAVQVGAVGGSVTVIHLHAPGAEQIELLAQALMRMVRGGDGAANERRKRR